MGTQPMLLARRMGDVFVVNLVLGGGLVGVVYKLMEKQVASGVVGGTTLGVVVIWGEATLGEQYSVPSVNDMKGLIPTTAVGAMLGHWNRVRLRPGDMDRMSGDQKIIPFAHKIQDNASS